MLRLLVLALLFAAASAAYTCSADDGFKMTTFSGETVKTFFACKYHALRRTRCGDYYITLTPGLAEDPQNARYYAISTMWVSAQNVQTGATWRGRTSNSIANKFQTGRKSAPFNTKNDYVTNPLSIDSVFSFENDTNQVSLVELNGQFRIDYHIYDLEEEGRDTSGFTFTCNDGQIFEPTDFETQLCGNGTSRELKTLKRSLDVGQKVPTIMYQVFNHPGITQLDEHCIAVQNAFQSCSPNGVDKREETVGRCWYLLKKRYWIRCVKDGMHTPISAFRYCVQLGCSGYTDTEACEELSDRLYSCDRILADVTPSLNSGCSN